jgi:arylsulfatase A-like enzyme
MASMLKSVDESFGRLLAALEKLGVAERTLVIFYSDNGGNTHSNKPDDRRAAAAGQLAQDRIKDWRKWAGDRPPTNNAPLRDGKGTLYEGGTRVPLMVAWPGVVEGGAVSEDVVGHIDLYPTILEALGVPPPAQQKLDGMSFASVLRGGAPLGRPAFFNYFPHGGPAKPPGVTVRSGDWKLIRWFEAGPKQPDKYELYNLRDDIGETKNLAATNEARVKAMDRMIDRFLEDTGANYPRPNPAYRPGAAAEGEPKAAKKKRKSEN